MRNGEHSTGGAADTAQAAAPARAAAEAGGGTATTGWLDRIALRNRLDTPSIGALRPRLPYPFEAMQFATADAGPRVPPPDGLRAAPEEAAATMASSGRSDDFPSRPASDLHHPLPRASTAMTPFDPAAAASPAWQRQQAHPVASARPAGRFELTPPKQERTPPNRDAHAPSAIPSVAVTPSQPAYLAASGLARLAPTAAGRLLAAPAHNATPAASMPAMQDDHGIAHATPRRASPAPGGKPAPQPAEASAAPMRPASAERPQPALRGAPPQQAPLVAKPSAASAQEITIDIHIGRIDVRAPAGPPASTAAQAPPQRGSDALNTYLSRRARGARS
ncbi:hypothetical protein [Duganella vulcania]|uniref:Uncharacterized protein n=1 Tax=Duganella vulcania TaxID=2692166 RepID=A0A845H147_9BURK|nr:hypothetical protein [Duganella vulcania]MYM98429.1 hypothetical protein [Duganella vulcania]